MPARKPPADQSPDEDSPAAPEPPSGETAGFHMDALKSAVREVLQELGVGESKPEKEEPEPRTAHDIEAAAEAAVKKALKALKLDREDHKEDSSKKEEEEVPETPPARRSRLQEFIWGKGAFDAH